MSQKVLQEVLLFPTAEDYPGPYLVHDIGRSLSFQNSETALEAKFPLQREVLRGLCKKERTFVFTSSSYFWSGLCISSKERTYDRELTKRERRRPNEERRATGMEGEGVPLRFGESLLCLF